MGKLLHHPRLRGTLSSPCVRTTNPSYHSDALPPVLLDQIHIFFLYIYQQVWASIVRDHAFIAVYPSPSLQHWVKSVFRENVLTDWWLLSVKLWVMLCVCLILHDSLSDLLTCPFFQQGAYASSLSPSPVFLTFLYHVFNFIPFRTTRSLGQQVFLSCIPMKFNVVTQWLNNSNKAFSSFLFFSRLWLCLVLGAQLLSCVWLFATPWTATCQASLSFTIFWSLLKLMCIESVMPSNHLILCRPLLLLLSIFPSIMVFSNELALQIKWPKYWSFSLRISPSNEYSEPVSFRMDWFDLLAVHGTLQSLLQQPSSKASILQSSAFFMVQLSYPYMTTGKTIALTIWIFAGKVMSLPFTV